MPNDKEETPIEEVYNQTTLLQEIVRELREIKRNVKLVELELSVIKQQLKR